MASSMNTQQNMCSNVINFISDFKQKYPEAMEDTFLHGYCYWFAFILAACFNGNVCYEPVDNHFFAWIQGEYYDITGQLESEGKVIWIWEIYKQLNKLETERIEKDYIRKERVSSQ